MGKNYTVQRISPITKIGPTGELEHYQRIDALTGGGTRFSVDVRDTDATAEKVAPVLEKRATELDAIKRL
jgi:hypothetical protein